MKKMVTLLVVVGAALVLASGSMAASVDNEDTPGVGFTVTDGLDTPNLLSFKFSPKVIAQYATDDGETATNKQWYAICTYHADGENFYGTSSSDTLIYKKSRETDEALTDAAIPTSKAADSTDATTGQDTDDDGVEDPTGWADGWGL
jgi:hypothetical protein